MVHLLSPFDPLVIQRKRLHLFFGYEHRFEAYVPKEKRQFGYFALPTLVGDEIVAAIDLKTDRAQQKLLMQKWTWVGKGSARAHKKLIEEELHRFERFQLAAPALAQRAISFSHSSSVSTVTPSSCALLSFDPASAPATT